jgi:hypothetical protein
MQNIKKQFDIVSVDGYLISISTNTFKDGHWVYAPYKKQSTQEHIFRYKSTVDYSNYYNGRFYPIVAHNGHPFLADVLQLPPLGQEIKAIIDIDRIVADEDSPLREDQLDYIKCKEPLVYGMPDGRYYYAYRDIEFLNQHSEPFTDRNTALRAYFKRLNFDVIPVASDVEQLGRSDALNNTRDDVKTWVIELMTGSFVRGYKAANPKQFTADDLLSYMDLRMKIWKKSIKEQEFAHLANPFEATERAVHQRAIEALVKSLQPVPKAISILCDENGNPLKENNHAQYIY